MEHTIHFGDGVMRFVYHDDLVDLLQLGASEVRRASHVEPHPTRGGWIADMEPSADVPENACIIGANGTWFKHCPDGAAWQCVEPFKTRAEALAAERAWLAEHRGL